MMLMMFFRMPSQSCMKKQKAINWYLSTNDDSFAWENTKEDAEQIGLKIHSLDDHRPNSGEFIVSAESTAQQIIENHGKTCETYKTASEFIDDCKMIVNSTPVIFEEGTEDEYEDYSEREQQLEDRAEEFLESLLEDYRIMYNTNIDYENSDKAAIEAIEANEYGFTKEGNRF